MGFERSNSPVAKGHAGPSDLTRKDLADVIGGSRQLVSALLNDLEAEGALERERHRLTCEWDLSDGLGNMGGPILKAKIIWAERMLSF
jgi:hypothetical protein